jgi:hypothetical protein
MRRDTKSAFCKKSPPAWHDGFMALVPAIEKYAKRAFRHLDAEAREEMVQETICNGCAAFARLVALGKTDLAYPTALAKFGLRQAIAGRKVGGNLNIRDVSSLHCHRQKGIVLERLDRFDREEDAWREILIEDKHAGPAEVAASRIDFAGWLGVLPGRLRKIARFLAKGETTTDAAKKFRVSPGRISQIRSELCQAWNNFHGAEPGFITV